MIHRHSRERPNGVQRIAQALVIVLLAFAVVSSIGQIRTAQAADPTTVTIHLFDCPIDYDSGAVGADPATDCTAAALGVTVTQRNAANTVISTQATSAANAGTVEFTIPNGENHSFTETTASSAQFVDCVATNSTNGTVVTSHSLGAMFSFNAVLDFVECSWFNVQLSNEQPVPGIALVKTADTYSAVVGETITYTFSVTNTGDTPLENVSLYDPLPNLQWIDGPNLGPLPATGSVAIGTATYVVTQADADAGEVRNVAGVEAAPVDCLYCDNPYAEDDVIVNVREIGSISIEKTANVTEAKLGDEIIYTFRLTNTGAFDLLNVTVNDPLSGLVWLNAQNYDMLAVGEERILHATYTVIQADVDAQSIHNVVTVTGEILNDCHICEMATASDDVTVITAPEATPPAPMVDPCTGQQGSASGVRALQPAPATPVVDEGTPESTGTPIPDATVPPEIDITETATPNATPTGECPSPTPTPTTPNDPPSIPVISELPNTGAAGDANRNGFDWTGICVVLGAAGALIIGSTTARSKVRGRRGQ